MVVRWLDDRFRTITLFVIYQIVHDSVFQEYYC